MKEVLQFRTDFAQKNSQMYFGTSSFWYFPQNNRSLNLFVDNQHTVGQFGIVCPYSVIRDYFQTIYIPFPQTLTTLSLLNTHLWRYFATNHPNCISKLFLYKIMTTNDDRIILGTFGDIKSNIFKCLQHLHLTFGNLNIWEFLRHTFEHLDI